MGKSWQRGRENLHLEQLQVKNRKAAQMATGFPSKSRSPQAEEGRVHKKSIPRNLWCPLRDLLSFPSTPFLLFFGTYRLPIKEAIHAHIIVANPSSKKRYENSKRTDTCAKMHLVCHDGALWQAKGVRSEIHPHQPLLEHRSYQDESSHLLTKVALCSHHRPSLYYSFSFRE